MQNAIFNSSVIDASAALSQWLDPLTGNHSTWARAKTMLYDLACSAAASAWPDLERAADTLARLLEIVIEQTPHGSAPNSDLREITAFVESAALTIVRSAESDAEGDALREIVSFAQSRWGDCLSLLGDNDSAASFNNATPCALDENRDEDETAPLGELDSDSAAQQIDLILDALGESEPKSGRSSAESSAQRDASSCAATGLDCSREATDLLAEPELRDAFLYDANCGLQVIEQIALELERGTESADAHATLCRQMHTLKGACASVGLAEMADRLHRAEEQIQKRFTQKQRPDSEILFVVIDSLRNQIARLTPNAAPAAHLSTQANSSSFQDSSAASPQLLGADVSEGEAQQSVRVRSSKLDRLMDLLAELVVLRNRRDTQIAALNQFNQELVRCGVRLKRFADQLADFGKAMPTADPFPTAKTPAQSAWSQLGSEIANSNAIVEVASDLSEISREIRSITQPLGEENTALSHFIRQFRQEMMQMRRLPVSGLFQRLRRAVRDAARSEGKNVQIELVGNQSMVEQSLQEKLYEPLLHIVRNGVSHGIEDQATRQQLGKPLQGLINLHINSHANLLVIEVSDDGRGLNFDAIRRRALQRGLLTADKVPTRRELAQLIFAPGFSTRDTVSEISGRGVGMDVVANVVDRLNGRVEVDSSGGKGTTIRLSIPLRSGIEHVMVFRSANQLFSLPTHSVSVVETASGVRGSGRASESTAPVPAIYFSSLVGLSEAERVSEVRTLVVDLGNTTSSASQRVSLFVDEILGSEEVVVRPLPELLRNHPLASGVTLSGGGQMVLAIDPVRIWDLGQAVDQAFCSPRTESPTDGVGGGLLQRILLVDDSLSARVSMAKRLQRLGFETSEACDGMEALDRLRSDSFALVVTDLDMPRLGGLELLNELRLRRMIDVPVAVVSGRTEPEIQSRAIRYGARCFLNKPVNDELLKRMLQDVGLLSN